MGMNGSIGRARQLAKIKRERRREAAEDGVNIADPVAYAAWEKERFNSLVSRLMASAGLPADESKGDDV
jgi:hypothetical protein